MVLESDACVCRWVYLAALSQGKPSSQEQQDVPGHLLVNRIPVQKSLRGLYLLALLWKDGANTHMNVNYEVLCYLGTTQADLKSAWKLTVHDHISG